MSSFSIIADDLCGSEIANLLNEHMSDMLATSPPESVHALDLDKLKQPEISFWSVYQGEELVGCGALKELSSSHAEIKSMRTANAHRGKGVASTMLQHIIAIAKQRGYQQLSLETGSMDYFNPARNMYRKYGFQSCPPFADYVEDPNSVFMQLNLAYC